MAVVSLVHATSQASTIVNSALKPRLPGVELVNFLDESLMRDVNQTGRVAHSTARRFVDLCWAACELRPDVLFVTCSSFGALLPAVRATVEPPVIGPDEAMIEQAVGSWSRIMVVGTMQAAVGSAATRISAGAHERGCKVELVERPVESALSALRRGDKALHDSIIVDAVSRDTGDAQAIILCQFTMAHLEERIRSVTGLPVLSSLTSALDCVETALRGEGAR